MKAGDKYPLMTRFEHDAEIRVVREAHKGAVVQSWAWGFICGIVVGVLATTALFVAFLYVAMQTY